MPHRVRRGTPRAATAAALLLAVAAGCRQQEVPPELPPRAIQWERISAAPAGERRVLSGIVTAVDDTRLAFEAGGTVASVEVNLGDTVAKNQVLARLDPEPFDLAIRDAEAALAKAAAERDEARATFLRFEQAAESGAVARQELDVARATRDAREGRTAAAEARLALAHRDARRAVLRAPFRGVIAVREIDPAMKVAAGQAAFALDSGESGLRVEVQMPETLIARVRQGDGVSVTFPAKTASFDAGDRRFAGLVTEVGTRAGSGNAFPVRADVLEPPEGLLPGMTAEVEFSLARGAGRVAGLEGFLIPIAAALPEADDQLAVFVFDEASSTVSKRPIRVGGVGSDAIAVFEGLAEGEIIATAGVSFLSDGQRVTLLDPELLPTRR